LTTTFAQNWKQKCESPESRLRKVNETLRLGLLSRQSVHAIKAYRVRAKNLGLKPGYSFGKPWDLIEEVEASGYFDGQ
jgi:hypothetical protein